MQIHLESSTLRHEAMVLTFRGGIAARDDDRLTVLPVTSARSLRVAVDTLRRSGDWEQAAWLLLAVGSAGALALSFGF